MILLKSAVCDSKYSWFIKVQETNKLLSTLGLKAPSSKIPIFGNISF